MPPRIATLDPAGWAEVDLSRAPAEWSLVEECSGLLEAGDVRCVVLHGRWEGPSGPGAAAPMLLVAPWPVISAFEGRLQGDGHLLAIGADIRVCGTAGELAGHGRASGWAAHRLATLEELKKVEDEIEQVMGRMNYLFDRAAYSTITLTLQPEINLPTYTPTPTVTVTPTPTVTVTPTPWGLGPTIKQSSGVLVDILKILAELLVWIVVVLLPFVLPAALVIWLIVYLATRRQRKQRKALEQPAPPNPNP